MAREYRYEVPKVGPAIMAHRIALGVNFGQLCEAGEVGADQVYRFVERADHPSIVMIEKHHQALMKAYPTGEMNPPAQLCRREQWYATADDVALWRIAQEQYPQIAWWWGARNESDKRGAFCYLCGSIVHGYDVGRGLTLPARKAVMHHRMHHIDELRIAEADARKESAQ